MYKLFEHFQRFVNNCTEKRAFETIPGSAGRLELNFRRLFHESDQVLAHRDEVSGVDECEAEFDGPLLDGDVRVLQAVEDGGAVPLNSFSVALHDPEERVQSHVPDVLVGVEEKPS